MAWLRVLPLLAAAVVVAIAGCSGAPAADRSTPAPVDTPAPVPTEGLPDDRIAPGVSPDGVADADRLAAAHDEYLSTRSYAMVSGTRYRFENGTVLYRTTHNRSVDRANGRELLVRERSGDPRGELHRPDTSYAEWRNETLAVERTVRGSSARYHRRESRDLHRPHHGGGVAEFVAEHDPDVVGKRPATDTTEYVLVARNVSDVTLLDRLDADLTMAPRLVAVVTREGLVRSVRLRARGTFDGEPVRANYYVRYTAVGTETVKRPPWLDEALAATALDEPVRGSAPTTGERTATRDPERD